jgi:ABC-type oligopeptide transport system ATPase subunit
MKLVQVDHVKKYFPVQRGFSASLFSKQKEYVRAVDDVSFEMERGDVLGLVGESGSGKTTIGRLCVRLLIPTEGKILFDGTDISTLKGHDMRLMRRRFQLTFQDPSSSLNPRMSIGNAIADAMRLQGLNTPKERRKEAEAVLE